MGLIVCIDSLYHVIARSDSDVAISVCSLVKQAEIATLLLAMKWFIVHRIILASILVNRIVQKYIQRMYFGT